MIVLFTLTTVGLIGYWLYGMVRKAISKDYKPKLKGSVTCILIAVSFVLIFVAAGREVSRVASKGDEPARGVGTPVKVEKPAYKAPEVKYRVYTQEQENRYKNNYKATKSEDKLEKSIFISLDNTLSVDKKDKDLYDVQNIHFTVSSSSKDSKVSAPLLSIRYYAKDWLFIDSATLYVDDTKRTLFIGRDNRDVISGGLISEAFYFKTDEFELADIINAKKVVLRLSGKKGYVDATFTEQNFYNFQRFYKENIEPSLKDKK